MTLDYASLVKARPRALVRLAASLGIHEPWALKHERLARLVYRVIAARGGVS